jgi:acetyl-CoA acetyltransferase
MAEAFICDGVRTPIGRYGGRAVVGAGRRPGAMPLRALMARARRRRLGTVDVVFGCANQAGEDNRNVARMAALLAGLPIQRSGRPSTACAARAWMPSPRRRGINGRGPALPLPAASRA